MLARATVKYMLPFVSRSGDVRGKCRGRDHRLHASQAGLLRGAPRVLDPVRALVDDHIILRDEGGEVDLSRMARLCRAKG